MRLLQLGDIQGVKEITCSAHTVYLLREVPYFGVELKTLLSFEKVCCFAFVTCGFVWCVASCLCLFGSYGEAHVYE